MFPGESKFGGCAVREEGVSETRRLSAWGRSSEKQFSEDGKGS